MHLRTTVLAGATTHMSIMRRGCGHHPVSRTPQRLGHHEFFPVEETPFIQGAHFGEGLGTKQDAGTGEGIDWLAIGDA